MRAHALPLAAAAALLSAAAPAGAAGVAPNWRVTSVEVDGTTTINRTEGDRTLTLTGKTGYHGVPRANRLTIRPGVPAPVRLTGLDIAISSQATLSVGGELVDCSWTLSGPALPPALVMMASVRNGAVRVQYAFAPAAARCPDGAEPPDAPPLAQFPTALYRPSTLRGRTAKLRVKLTQTSEDGGTRVHFEGVIGLRRLGR